MREHHLAARAGLKEAPPPWVTRCSLYPWSNLSSYPPYGQPAHLPEYAPGELTKATRGDAAPDKRLAVTISTIASKRDLISSKTRLASGSLLKKAAANLSHSARLSKPVQAWPVWGHAWILRSSVTGWCDARVLARARGRLGLRAHVHVLVILKG